jgi:hypothetical protein
MAFTFTGKSTRIRTLATLVIISILGNSGVWGQNLITNNRDPEQSYSLYGTGTPSDPYRYVLGSFGGGQGGMQSRYRVQQQQPQEEQYVYYTPSDSEWRKFMSSGGYASFLG